MSEEQLYVNRKVDRHLGRQLSHQLSSSRRDDVPFAADPGVTPPEDLRRVRAVVHPAVPRTA